MPIVAQQTIPIETSAVRLARYAQIIQYDEDRFWGIARGTPTTSCRQIWTLPQRLMVAKYLAEAQVEFERVVGYPVGYRWITEKKRVYRPTALANYAEVVEGGIQAISDISINAAVDQSADPAVIGPIAGITFTDINEVHVFHPGSDIEIDPSWVEISGGNLTIKIPRCRTINEANANNPAAGLDYNSAANFETKVDVKRIYNDPSQQVTFYNNHRCSAVCADSGCSDYTETGCLYVAEPEIGSLKVYPATYSSGSWSRLSALCCNSYRWMKLYYRAGVELDFDTEDAITRLAHSKMPVSPCGCDPAQSVWDRDRHVPDPITQERINCPWGTTDGAWFAWQQALDMKVYRGGGIL